MAKAKKKSSELTFEALMDELEDTVERLEGDDLSLEEAIGAYQKGVQLAKDGHDRLTAAERRIEEVTRSGKLKSIDADELLDHDGDQ
jgi:exodeoxyribonuclease VII small subunit